MDPLRNGSIFRLDRDSLNKIRSPPFKNSPTTTMKESTHVRPPEHIAGVREKFEDLYRSTPNPMLALTGKSPSQSYSRPAQRLGNQYNVASAGSRAEDDATPASTNTQDLYMKCDGAVKVASLPRQNAEDTNREETTRGIIGRSTDRDAHIAPAQTHQTHDTHIETSDKTRKVDVKKKRVALASSSVIAKAEHGLVPAPTRTDRKRKPSGDDRSSRAKNVRDARDRKEECAGMTRAPPEERGHSSRSQKLKSSSSGAHGSTSGQNRESSTAPSIGDMNSQDKKKGPPRALPAEGPPRKRSRGQVNSLSFLDQRLPPDPRTPVAAAAVRSGRSDAVVVSTHQRGQHVDDVQGLSGGKGAGGKGVVQSKRRPTTDSSVRSLDGVTHRSSDTNKDIHRTRSTERVGSRQQQTRGSLLQGRNQRQGEEGRDDKKTRAKWAARAMRVGRSSTSKSATQDTADGAAGATTTERVSSKQAGTGRRQGGDGLAGIGCSNLISSRTRSRVKSVKSSVRVMSSDVSVSDVAGAISTPALEPGAVSCTAQVPDHTSAPDSDIPSWWRGQDTSKKERTVWTTAELSALVAAHKLCEITAPDFWDQVAAEMLRTLEVKDRGSAVVRTANECQAKWFNVRHCL